MSSSTKLNDNRLSKLGWACALCFTLTSMPALADGNNFFGTNAGGASTGPTSAAGSGAGLGTGASTGSNGEVDENSINAGLPGLTTPPAMPPSGDYSDDEKRMQRKYKENIAHAKQLIAKGESMMKSSNKEAKEYKRGKILKETGEKWLAELKANDPYATDKTLTSSTEANAKDAKQKK